MILFCNPTLVAKFVAQITPDEIFYFIFQFAFDLKNERFRCIFLH
jgi:hypothetical protein